MNRQVVLSLSKKIIRRSRDTAMRLKQRLLPKEEKMLFVFGGRTQHWPGLGKDLYEKEPAFRETVNNADKIIREIAGISILENFEGPGNETFFDSEEHVVFTIIVIQIAVFELWKARGKAPSATLGVSLGEVGAVYAAGGLDLKDALRIAVLMASLNQLEQKDFSVLYLLADMETAYRLSGQCPVQITPIYEAGQKGVLIFCHKDDVSAAANFLRSQNIAWKVPHQETSWPYHTAMMAKHRETIRAYVKDIDPKPLQCDYYSCTDGKKIPKNSIIPADFWIRLTHSPVLTFSAFQTSKTDGFSLFVNMGPNLSMRTELGDQENGRIKLLDTINKKQPEIQTFTAALTNVRKLKTEGAVFSHADDLVQLNKFKKHVNFLEPSIRNNPYPSFRYLQKRGSVHFLPAYNAWIVLDYEDIDYVTKHPEFFSSTIYSGFDAYLLGADPPSHTLVRSLLQPLFSPAAFARLGAFTTLKSNELLDQLGISSEFNFVDEFSLPLAKSVVAKFLGLTDAEEETLDHLFDDHIYSLSYINVLEGFFRKHLEYYHEASGENVAGLLLSFVKDGRLSFDGAVSLMKMLWVAGMTTTSALLGNAILMLAENPGVAQQLRENDQLINKFIEECLRLETPESELKRITTQAVRLGNEMIPANAVVMLGFRAANRDPRYFENPDEIYFDRPVKRHLSFGGGYHFCLGAGLARLEAKHALKVLMERLPAIELGTGNEVVYYPSEHFRGLTRLVIRSKK